MADTNNNILREICGKLCTITELLQNPTTTDIFTGLTTGSTVTLTQTPLKIFTVSRNGLDQLLGATNDYTISGTTVTFNVAFGISGGAQGAEQVRVFYTY